MLLVNNVVAMFMADNSHSSSCWFAMSFVSFCDSSSVALFDAC
jgi:hypothetical protein